MDMSLEWAEFISWLSNWALVTALVVGVISTYGIVVSGNVKEAALKGDVAIANAAAAQANRVAESEKLERIKTQKAIVDELAPRDLTKDQISSIAGDIKGRIKTLYLYPLSDFEAQRYAYSIAAALKEADVDVKLVLTNVAGKQPVFPDKFNAAVSMLGLTAYEFPSGGPDGAVTLLLNAFQKANVAIIGQWSDNPIPVFIDGNWSTESTVQSPALFVGLKPTPFTKFPEWAMPSKPTEIAK